jgi:hypothetical protein
LILLDKMIFFEKPLPVNGTTTAGQRHHHCRSTAPPLPVNGTTTAGQRHHLF